MAWNAENEDGSIFRQADRPHQVALKVVGFTNKALSDIMGFPTTKRDMFNKLQMRLVVFNDRIEVNGKQPIDLLIFNYVLLQD